MKPINWDRIRRLGTHINPHPEEMIAIILAWRLFRWTRSSEIVYWSSRRDTPDGRPMEAWEGDGYVFFGTGGGRYDEHAKDGQPRRGKECSVTLFARDLGIVEPSLLELLEYARSNDLAGRHREYGQIASMAMAKQGEGEPTREVIEWVEKGIIPLLRAREKFFACAKEATQAGVRYIKMPGRQQPLRVVSIRSDARQVATHLFSKEGGRADIVIVQASSGHVRVQARKTNGRPPAVSLQNFVRCIRAAERTRSSQETGKRWRRVTWEQLGAEGSVPGARCWHYTNCEWLLNGSLSMIEGEIPVTLLTLEQVEELLLAAFDQRRWPEVAREIRQDHCIAA